MSARRPTRWRGAAAAACLAVLMVGAVRTHQKLHEAVGPALAVFLDLPHVGAVTALDIASDGKHFTARRRIEGAEEVVECDLPALLSIEKGLVEPRYPSLPNLMKAKKKPVTVLTSAELPGLEASNAGVRFESISPPAPRPECKFIDGEPPQMAKELVRLLQQEAKVL